LNSENMHSFLPVLAVETSAGICGACVYFSKEKFFQSVISFKNIHAEKLLDTIDSVLKAADLQPKELKGIAVSAGPGSFTGLRIGMSAVKGIAFGLSLPVIPVPTFEAMALQISKYLPENSYFIIANRVNSEEVYFAKFQIISNNYIFVENLRILRFNEFLSISKGTLTFGNVIKIKDNSSDYKTDIFAPEPRYVAEWAVESGKQAVLKNIDYLEPNYLKNFIIKVRKND
jgi:tRNA threonylcarbamoyladenosine biosynthesis protein TsaB